MAFLDRLVGGSLFVPLGQVVQPGAELLTFVHLADCQLPFDLHRIPFLRESDDI